MPIEIEPFSLQLSRPLETAAGTIETRRGFVVRVELDGTVGVGESAPLPGWTESIEACERTLKTVEDPVSALEEDRLATAPAARHGVSLAVLDARARADDQPLYRYLGGTERVESVPVNATVGDGSADETAAATARAVTAGYPAVKLKVGARDPEEDLARLDAVRSRCRDVELRIDANGAWSEDVVDRLLPELAGIDVAVLEQPLPAERLEAHAGFRGRGVEIALDESVVAVGPDRVIESGAADLLICKPMALGGIDVARRMIEKAREEDIDGIVTTTIDGAIARMAATHLAASLRDIRPCGLATGGLLSSDLLEESPEPSSGRIAVTQRKGNIPPR